MDCRASNNFFEHIFNPNCGLDIYETCSRDVWINCRVSQVKTGLIVISVLFLISILIFVVTKSGLPFMFISFGLLIASSAGFFWTDYFAGLEWDRFQKQIDIYKSKYNLSDKEALDKYIGEVRNNQMVNAINNIRFRR